jgi:hypothetical protein
VFSGAVVAAAIWIVLNTLGLAMGLPLEVQVVALTSDQLGVAEIWALSLPIVALFLGSVVTSKASGTASRWLGALHGVVLWGFLVSVGGTIVLAASWGTSRLAPPESLIWWLRLAALMVALFSACVGGALAVAKKPKLQYDEFDEPVERRATISAWS